MKYECPSCFMRWEDTLDPKEQLSHPLCIFCSTRHTQEELLKWQMDHLEEISHKKFTMVLKNFYRYVVNEIEIQKARNNDQKDSR